MEVSRRKMGTYGKPNRRVLVHDLFDVAQKEPSLYETLVPPATRNAAASGTSTPFSEVSEDPEASQQLRQELSAFADASQITSRGRTPRSKSATPANASSPSLFDLESSSDEMKPKSKAETTKRRKLASKSSNVRLFDAATTASPTSISEQALTSQSPKKAGVAKSRLKTRTAQKRKASPKKIPSGLRKATSEDAETHGPDDFHSDHPSPLNSSQDTPPDLGSPLSEKSASSIVSTRSTPKRKRQAEEDLASDFSSPSQLELSSLRLTPNRRFNARARSNDSKDSEPSSRTPSKARGRLVDRLDSPAQSLSQEVGMMDASPRPKKSRKLQSPHRQALPDEQENPTSESSLQPHLQRGDGERSDLPAPRSRTYGKQRSHLQDMVPGLESQVQSSSQHSLQDLVSQVESLTAAKSQFGIENDSDDEDSGLKLKSIHELRHAGLANRFDRDLEALFEDIESGNRSLRIQGLMSLVRKLQEKTFKAHVLASGKLSRLVDVATPDLDLPSATVLVLGLWALAVAETATSQALAQVYDCLLQLPPAIITEQRAVFKIAKDRKENISKALVRDLADFEQHVLDKSVKHEGQAEHIILSRVSLRCLELTLRRIVGLAGRATDAPVPVFRAVLNCIKHNLEEIAKNGERPELVESIRLLLSWLELAAASSVNIGHNMPASLLEHYGTVLSEVMRWSKKFHPAIGQSSIRSAVEMSNGNSAVCLRFANTPLLSAAFNVVEEHFSRLATIDGEGKTDSDKLNSVILALGCLLNFADCSDKVRMKMMVADGAAHTQVDRLVKIFNVFVDEVGEASFIVLGKFVQRLTSTDNHRRTNASPRRAIWLSVLIALHALPGCSRWCTCFVHHQRQWVGATANRSRNMPQPHEAHRQ